MKARHLGYKPQTQDRERKFQQHTFNNRHNSFHIFYRNKASKTCMYSREHRLYRKDEDDLEANRGGGEF